MANLEALWREIPPFILPPPLEEAPPQENHALQRFARERFYEIKKEYVARLEANPELILESKVYPCYLRAKAIVALYDRNLSEGYRYLFESAVLGHKKSIKHLLKTKSPKATIYKSEYYKKAFNLEFAISYLLKSWETHKCSETATALSRYYGQLGNESERVRWLDYSHGGIAPEIGTT